MRLVVYRSKISIAGGLHFKPPCHSAKVLTESESGRGSAHPAGLVVVADSMCDCVVLYVCLYVSVDVGTGVLGVLYVCVIEDFELRTVYSVSSVSCSNLYLIIRWWQFTWGKSNLYVTEGRACYDSLEAGGVFYRALPIAKNGRRTSCH